MFKIEHKNIRFFFKSEENVFCTLNLPLYNGKKIRVGNSVSMDFQGPESWR